MLEMLLPGRVSRSRAWRICSAVIAGGRPRRWPRARAASRPSRVPSTMSSRMNLARAAKTWKTSRRPGWWCPAPRAGTEPDAAAAQPGHDGDQVLQGPGQPVQARHDQGVAGAEVVQARGELGTVGGLARQLVGEDPDAAGLGQARVCRSRICPDVDTRAYPISAPVRFAGSGASRSSWSAPAMPARVSVTLRPYGKRRCRSCWTRRVLNTFFRQSPPAGNHDRGPAGRVSENRSILDRPDTGTASERSSRAGTLEAGKLPPSRGVRARRTTRQRPVAATVRA